MYKWALFVPLDGQPRSCGAMTRASCQLSSLPRQFAGQMLPDNLCDERHMLLNALPTFTPRNRDGAAPCPVLITCCGCPLPQFGVPHKVHSSLEQIASREFQNSVVMPE